MICKTERIRALNDELRASLTTGHVVMTQGVASLSDETRDKLIQAVRRFDAFDEKNDPYGEHDFGSLQVDGSSVVFKIDYHDCTMQCHSPDPADPDLTIRVMTIMLIDEY